MLLTKEVNIKINAKNLKYYREVGYEINHVGDIVTVKIEDLLKGSHAVVDVLCDYCNKSICHTQYKNYNRSIKINGKYSCINCHGKKTKETNLIVYGTENIMNVESIQEKYKETIRNRYGVEHYSQTEEYKEKYKNTCMNKFGADHPFKNDDIKNKVLQTNINKYGVDNPMKNNIIRQKAIDSSLDKYGVEYPSKLPKIREKMVQTLYKNSSQKVSSQQLYLHNLYGGKLNYPIFQYSADICFPEENITIEYNGGGHMLNVITGRETQEEYNRKEIIRNSIIKRAGYKQITIISSKDFLPSDEILLEMLEQAKQYFNTTNHTWVEYNIDASLMRNAENKEGVFFDFGELRKIKKIS